MRTSIKNVDEKIVAYRSDFMKIDGVECPVDCLILSQLYYWAKKMNFKQFYKTDSELAQEIGLPLRTLRSHKKNLRNVSFLKTLRAGVPAKTYYMLSQLDCPTSVNLDCPTSVNLYTEQKNTTENTTEKKKKASSSSSPFSLFAQECKKLTGKSFKDIRVSKWFAEASQQDAEAVVRNLEKYLKACNDSGREVKLAFYVLDRLFEKPWVTNQTINLTIEDSQSESVNPLRIVDQPKPKWAKDMLLKQFDEPTYLSWFAQCEVIEEQETVCVKTPNAFVKSKIESMFSVNSAFKNWITQTSAMVFSSIDSIVRVMLDLSMSWLGFCAEQQAIYVLASSTPLQHCLSYI